MDRSKQRLWSLTAGAALVALCIAAWEVACRAEWVSPLAMPSPSSILWEAGRLLADAQFWSNWTHTLFVWVVSLIGGLALGCILGFVTGSNYAARCALSPCLAYVRAIPPIVLFPIAMIAMGAGDTPIMVVATLSAALYIYPLVAAAASAVVRQYRELGQVLGVTGPGFLYRFVIPATLVTTVSAARVAATLTFIVCVAGEMLIGGRLGVGAAIVDLSERFLLAKAYGYIVYAGLLGITIDAIGAAVSRFGAVRQPSQRTEPWSSSS